MFVVDDVVDDDDDDKIHNVGNHGAFFLEMLTMFSQQLWHFEVASMTFLVVSWRPATGLPSGQLTCLTGKSPF